MRKIAHNEKDIQKRRATWPEQWTAHQSQGLTVEKIRETVFSTIDPDKELKGYIGKVKNALMGFENGVFSFSEEGLRASLKAANADLSQFQMQVDEEVKTEQTDRYVHDFLKFYYKRRDAYTQTCTITYKGIQMAICRWHIAGSPFGTYVLTPVLQIPCRKWMLTDCLPQMPVTAVTNSISVMAGLASMPLWAINA